MNRAASDPSLALVAAAAAATAAAAAAADHPSAFAQGSGGWAQARQQIDDLTERLSVATTAGGIGIWDWVIASGRVVLDTRMARLLDLPAAVELPEPELRRTMLALLQPDDAGRLDQALRAAVEQRLVQALRAAVEQQLPLSIELRRQGGVGERWLRLTGRTQVGADGQALRVVGCAWDSSAEHESARLLAAKEAAETASRAKSAFLSRMSHELRTPLNAILGFAQLMRMEAEGGDLVLKPHRVNLIETAARHLLDLVNEVLDVSRIESGQVDVRLARFDLREIVHESLPMVQGLADGAGVQLVDLAAAGPPRWVLGDRLRLKEVVINLLSNGIKYNRPGGRVELRSGEADEGCVLTVTDTGRGLDARQLQALFQPFNRLGAEASGIEGSGMGLFVSRRFVELMGGRIEVRSQPGAGTAFSVHLQAAPRGTEAAAPG